MHFLSQAFRLLVASLAVVHAAVHVDLAFPRNQTYAPSPTLPIIFAIQNPSFARALRLEININIWKMSNMNKTRKGEWIGIDHTGLFKGDMHFAYVAMGGLKAEGQYALQWDTRSKNCSGTPPGEQALFYKSNMETRMMFFTITTDESAPETDLAAATNNQDCHQEPGVSFDVSGTMEVPEEHRWIMGERCAVMGPSKLTADPCRVQINASAASSIAASMKRQACDHLYLNEPIGFDCSRSAAHQLAAASVVFITAAMGAVGFIFMMW